MELIKNNRFRTGSMVDIYHTPVFDANTIAITDVSVGNDYEVEAKFAEDISAEQFGIGDIVAFGFGVGEIISANGRGGLLTVSLVSGGTGYTQGSNTLTLVQDGASSGTITVTADAGGVVTSVDSVDTAGTGYYVESGVATTGGGNNDCTVSIDTITFVESTVHVQFPKSMFPDSNVAKYVGSEIQHTLFFLKTGRVEANFTVARYKEVVKQATYGYAKVVYNLQTEADLLLTPIRMVDDGTLSKILYSKGFVLKSCNDTDYEPTTTWNQDFPIELSGTSIDPIYRRAYLQKREMQSKSRKSRATMTFRLIG